MSEWAQMDGGFSFIDCGAADRMDNVSASGITLAAWVNFNTAGEFSLGRIIHKGFQGWAFYVSGTNPNITFGLLQFFTTTNGNWTYNGTLAINTRHHVAVTYTAVVGAVPVLYLNGEEVAITVLSTPVGTPKDDSVSNPQIGGVSGAFTFDGEIGQVAVYDRALAPNEMQRLYRLSPKYAQRDQIAWWKLMEGPPHVDCSGNTGNTLSDTAVTMVADGPPVQM